MQQLFQCYRCGAQNYIGQVYCWNCHEKFQYNCPWCNAVVEATFVNCPNCRAVLPWPAQQITGYQPSQPQPASPWQTQQTQQTAGYQLSQSQAGYSNIRSSTTSEATAGRPVWRSPWMIGAVCLVLLAAITLAALNIPGVLKTMNQSQPPIQTSQPGHQVTGTVDNEF